MNYLLCAVVAVLTGLAGAAYAGTLDIETADWSLGIKIGAPISESIPACADLPSGDKETMCFEPAHDAAYSIKQRPFLGFRYLATAYADDAGTISEIRLEALIENASLLKRLLTTRYQSEPKRLVEHVYSQNGTSESREVVSSVWLGNVIAVIFSAPDPFNSKDVTVSAVRRSAFDGAAARHEDAIEEMAAKL